MKSRRSLLYAALWLASVLIPLHASSLLACPPPYGRLIDFTAPREIPCLGEALSDVQFGQAPEGESVDASWLLRVDREPYQCTGPIVIRFHSLNPSEQDSYKAIGITEDGVLVFLRGYGGREPSMAGDDIVIPLTFRALQYARSPNQLVKWELLEPSLDEGTSPFDAEVAESGEFKIYPQWEFPSCPFPDTPFEPEDSGVHDSHDADLNEHDAADTGMMGNGERVGDRVERGDDGCAISRSRPSKGLLEFGLLCCLLLRIRRRNRHSSQ